MVNIDKDLWYRDKWQTGMSMNFLISFFILAVVMIFFIMKSDPGSIGIKKFDNLSNGFNVLSVVLLVYVIYITIQHNSKIEEQTVRHQSFLISKEFYMDIYDKMAHDFPETYFLYNELGPFDDRTTKEIEKSGDIKYNPQKRAILEEYYSGALIELFENFLSFKRYLIVNHFSWVKTFYYQFESAILREYWENLKDTYSPSTNEIIQQYIDISKEADKNNWSDEQVNKALLDIDFSKTTR